MWEDKVQRVLLFTDKRTCVVQRKSDVFYLVVTINFKKPIFSNSDSTRTSYKKLPLGKLQNHNVEKILKRIREVQIKITKIVSMFITKIGFSPFLKNKPRSLKLKKVE